MPNAIHNNIAKHPPIHPGELLEHEFLSPSGISQLQLAKTIGVDPTRVHSIVLGTRSITAETALLFSRFFGNSAQFWMGLQAQYDLERAQDKLARRLDAVIAHHTRVS